MSPVKCWWCSVFHSQQERLSASGTGCRRTRIHWLNGSPTQRRHCRQWRGHPTGHPIGSVCPHGFLGRSMNPNFSLYKKFGIRIFCLLMQRPPAIDSCYTQSTIEKNRVSKGGSLDRNWPMQAIGRRVSCSGHK